MFNRTGVSHLVAISGLHITMVAGLAALAMSWLWRRSFFTDAQLPLILPAFFAGLLLASRLGVGSPTEPDLPSAPIRSL